MTLSKSYNKLNVGDVKPRAGHTDFVVGDTTGDGPQIELHDSSYSGAMKWDDGKMQFYLQGNSGFVNRLQITRAGYTELRSGGLSIKDNNPSSLKMFYDANDYFEMTGGYRGPAIKADGNAGKRNARVTLEDASGNQAFIECTSGELVAEDSAGNRTTLS